MQGVKPYLRLAAGDVSKRHQQTNALHREFGSASEADRSARQGMYQTPPGAWYTSVN